MVPSHLPSPAPPPLDGVGAGAIVGSRAVGAGASVAGAGVASSPAPPPPPGDEPPDVPSQKIPLHCLQLVLEMEHQLSGAAFDPHEPHESP
mmetsp:Transcript_17823/g.40305  ORF Transcript_17823/g.40305 Transcript_17823/m.40305 type:complete len:91 (+) Transcript_17823:773-1045(+)